MTISSSVARNDFTGTGTTSVYPYTFMIFAETDLLVTKRDTSDVETTLLLNVDYTVSGVDSHTGGTVTLTAGNLATDFTLTIRRVRPITQITDIRNQGDFFPEVHEDTFDHLIMVDQQQQDSINRSVKLPETINPTSEFNPTLPSDTAGAITKCPITNINGNGWSPASAWPSAGDIANAQSSAAAAAASAAQAATFSGTNSPYGINNVGISATVAANALTIALKQSDGSTNPAAAGGAASMWFRSASATSGAFVQRVVTAALSLVVPSGGTLGHNDGLDDYIYVYVIDNVGTVELAVSSSWHWDEGQLISTSTLDTASDSASGIYSTAARANVPCRLIGRVLSTQATAGTWASAMTRVEPRNNFKLIDNPFTRAGNFNAKHGAFYLLSTAAARSIQLPTPRAGFKFKVKDSTGQASSTNTITLLRAAAENIEGTAGSFVYSTAFGSFEIWSDGTNWFVTDYISQVVTNVTELSNIGIAATVAGNALTFAVKQRDGSTDCTTSSPAVIAFKSATASSGAVNRRIVSAALSITIPAGATMGFSSNYAEMIYLYALDNAGVVELAVSSSNHHGINGSIITTKLLDTSSDDAGDIYSAVARTNLPFRLIGRIVISEAVAGTWASVPTVVESGHNITARAQRFTGLSAGVSNVNVHHDVVYIKPADGSTYNLQLPIPNFRFQFTVKRSSGGAGDNITIVRNGAESIDETAANYVLSASLESGTFYCNGTNWFRIR